MTELLTPALSGAAAGLGVAMPMGAMSVLLIQEAIRSRRAAVAAAAGIAAVDLGYAALATALGPWVASHVTPVEAWIRLLSAAILLALAGHGLWTHRGSARPVAGRPGAGAGAVGSTAGEATGTRTDGTGAHGTRAHGTRADDTRAGDTGADGTRADDARAVRTFGRYAALTAVNPTTALYFAALTTAQGAALGGGGAAGAFLGGVLFASLAWQQLLVAVGSFAGHRISATTRAWTFRLGYGLVAAYAVKIAIPLP
ncbi:LysE family transporter [Streptomyces sp. NPDC090022]|uniref:LysE family transporter n=1 Tax=Streptomyces sp. NPDC090022 TaxID=3365920 RepID=UPI0037FEAADC